MPAATQALRLKTEQGVLPSTAAARALATSVKTLPTIARDITRTGAIILCCNRLAMPGICFMEAYIVMSDSFRELRSCGRPPPPLVIPQRRLLRGCLRSQMPTSLRRGLGPSSSQGSIIQPRRFFRGSNVACKFQAVGCRPATWNKQSGLGE